MTTPPGLRDRCARVAALLPLLGVGLGVALALGGCGGPDAVRPTLEVAPAYQEAADGATLPPGTWQPARPQDALKKGAWWEIFNDPQLAALERQVDAGNQGISQAYDNLMAARAQVREMQAGYSPNLSVAPAAGRSHVPSTIGAAAGGNATGQTGNSFSLPFDASWEPDLWGRVRNQVHEFQYAAQVSAADLENERLTAQAALAVFYLELHGQDSLQTLYDQAILEDRRSVELTQSLLATGISSEGDVAAAQVTLAEAEAAAAGIGVNRAVYEHAIATLIGRSASQLRIPAAALGTEVPLVPVGVPSQLLERRPDIAAAERTMAQANALIKVERTAYYPSLTLSGSAGLESTALSTLFSAPAEFWSLGASLSELLVDGGLRKATVDQYQALYDADAAAYKQTVLAAFQQVEDGLSTLRILSGQIQRQDAAVRAAQRYLDLEQVRYQTGIDSYLSVISAETSLLAARENAVGLRISELSAAVQLIQALGGGWDISQLPAAGDDQATAAHD